MSALEQETHQVSVTISLDREVTIEEYARLFVAISQIDGVESVGGDPAIDIAKDAQ